MTAKEFAEKYAGQMAEVTFRDAARTTRVGRICAWVDNDVVIDDKSVQSRPRDTGRLGGVNVVPDACSGWTAPVNQVRLLGIDAPAKVTTSAKVDTPFPHKCPGCAAPAYIGFAKVDCSKNCNRR